MSKHDNIIKYIRSLSVGTRISVRSIASELKVSDGTAYKAIKDCYSMGIVTTIPRIGTIRTEKAEKKTVEALTFGDVVNIIEGTLLGGINGVYKYLNKFVIGAMTIDAMEKYISHSDLLIVGNREEVQKFALMNECGVLITGGFSCSEEIKNLANEKCLPVISSSYDTFTVATMINKAMSENIIKQDILFVEDIMNSKFQFFYVKDKIEKLKSCICDENRYKYPVVDENMKLEGIVDANDSEKDCNGDYIMKIMTKNYISVTPRTTVAYAMHIMSSEGMEFCPVIEGKKLIGIVYKRNALKALQEVIKQPQADMFDELVIKNFNMNKKSGSEMNFSGKIIPQMLSHLGTASWGTLNMLLTSMGITVLRQNNVDVSLDSVTTYFIKPVQVDSEININTKIINMGRNLCKLEVNMYDNKSELIGKSLMSAKILRK